MPFSLVKRLGQGGMGTVDLVQDTETKQQYVYKTFIRGRYEKDAKYFLRNEAKVLQAILPECNPYLSCIARTEDKEGKVRGIYIDYIPDSYELQSFLFRNRNSLTFYAKLVVMLRLLDGLATLHRLGVVHRDIKTENVLIVPATLQVRYIDYGLSCIKTDFPECGSRYVGSRFAVSPELILLHRERIDELSWSELRKSDVWALGVLFLELCFGIDDFFPDDKAIMEKNVARELRERLTPEDHAMPSKDEFFYKIITLMLEREQEERPSAGAIADLIKHEMYEELLEVAETTDLAEIERTAIDEAREIRVDPRTAIFPGDRPRSDGGGGKGGLVWNARRSEGDPVVDDRPI